MWARWCRVGLLSQESFLGGWVDHGRTYNVLHPVPFSWWDTWFPETSLVGSYENPSASHTHYLAGSETGLTQLLLECGLLEIPLGSGSDELQLSPATDFTVAGSTHTIENAAD